jgi:hypothetical protein
MNYAYHVCSGPSDDHNLSLSLFFKQLTFLPLVSILSIALLSSQETYECFDHHTYDNETISLFTYGEGVISVNQTKSLTYSSTYLTINSIDATGRITQIGKTSNFSKNQLLIDFKYKVLADSSLMIVVTGLIDDDISGHPRFIQFDGVESSSSILDNNYNWNSSLSFFNDSTFVNLDDGELSLLDLSGQLKHQFDIDASSFQLGDAYASGCLLYTESEVYSITQDTAITTQLSIPNIKSVNQRNGMYHITTQDAIRVYSSDFALVSTYPLAENESVIDITGHLNHVYYKIYNSETKVETIWLAIDDNPLVIVGDDPYNVAQCLHSSEDYLYTATSVIYDNEEFYFRPHSQSLVSKSVRGEEAIQDYDFVDGIDVEVLPVQLDSTAVLYYSGQYYEIPISGWYYSGEVIVTNSSSIDIETFDLYSRPYSQSPGFLAQTKLSIDSLISPGQSITVQFNILTYPSKLTANRPFSFVMLGANDRRFQEHQVIEAQVIGSSDDLSVSGLTLSPNPINDLFEVRGTDVNINQATLYNQMGKLVKMDQISKSTYSIDHLTPGIYLLRVVTDQGKILVSQLVKQ